ncbi:hypothetical protein COV04_02905 [Candidatus Uhrbacteria bacterium CG10_big_fil_rev_8_21_14_0_10_48_11]|uniref:PDZ domain-containing protein n=1 Tax=Candidatus Uhrbacteria bacterium CG10_big_fil_rev_8_21_14_0_10_48_11 TaxID=1975037 RepID=A0A2M8LEK9_9BACT|nr:MAG: hypothetical protein COV04_02905 [Candidatus Uhrbacteria bacterium CG10_big_fil_rev_8_21_14_0_10_48_11]
MPLTEIPTFPPKERTGIPLAILILIGLATGAAGAGLLLWFAPGLRRAEIPAGTQSVIVSSPGTVVVEEGSRINDIVKQSKAFMGAVYNVNSVIHIGDKNFYQKTAAKAAAISLTDDGWFGSIADVPIVVGDVISIQGEAHFITRIVKDTATPFVLLKVGDGTFSSARFMAAKDYMVGITVVATSPTSEAARMNITSVDVPRRAKDGITESSDTLSTVLGVTQNASVLVGSPVYSIGGDVVGLIDGGNNTAVIYPGDALRTLLDRVLRYDEPNRAQLGLRYAITTNVQSGSAEAFVYSASGSAVVAKSPAATAGLKAGDIIVSIDGKSAAESSNVFSILSSHIPGDQIVIKYMRGTETISKTVTLDSLSTGG